jgi:hypothetical protein
MLVAVLNSTDAQDLLRHCLAQGEVVPTTHFREGLIAEGLIFPDALHVLRTGLIYEPPEQDIKSREWKYRVEGTEPDGKTIAIVFSFKTIERVCLITIFAIESWRSI